MRLKIDQQSATRAIRSYSEQVAMLKIQSVKTISAIAHIQNATIRMEAIEISLTQLAGKVSLL